MKLTSIELHPSGSPNVGVMSFRDPARQLPYNVKGITGLDVNEIIARFYPGSSDPSKRFANLSPASREVVILVELNPDYSTGETFSDLRDALYKMIASSRTGMMEIQFKNGTTVVATVSGLVSKFEGGHFTKTPEVQVTVKCDDPMLRSPTPVVVDVVPLDPALTDIQDTESTAPHGFRFEVAFTAATPSFIIQDPNDSSWSFEVTPLGGFLTGDHLYFSSEYNGQELYMVRSGVTTYLADAIVPGSVWPILFPGSNLFSIDNPANVDWIDISHHLTYWGV